MTSGPAAGKMVEIERELVIGREDCDIELPDPEASRRHAAVRPAEGGIEVEDLGSMNGTHVNGLRIDKPVVVDSSSTMRIGASHVSFEVTPRPLPEQAPRSPDVTVARDVVAGPDVTVARDAVAGPDVTAPRSVVRGPEAPGDAPPGPGEATPPGDAPPSPDVTAPRDIPSPDVTAPRDVPSPDVTAPRDIPSPDVTAPRDVVKGPEVTAPRQTVSPPPDVTAPRDVVQGGRTPPREGGEKQPPLPAIGVGVAVALIILLILLLL